MEKVIARDGYLKELIGNKHNRLVKVVTGIRRCGKSYLLGTLFKRHLLDSGVPRDHIVEMSFDLFRNAPFRDPNVFFPWVTAQFVDDSMYYILLDEVQLLGEFVSVLNDLAYRPNCDVYVTGSNAKFLSKDIATEFGGRYTRLEMRPLSFSEFMSVYPGDEFQGLSDFLRYGSLPPVALKTSEAEKRKALTELLRETYLRDVVERHKVRNDAEIATLLKVLASSVGGLANPAKLANTFRSAGRSTVTAATLAKYIGYFEDAFLIEEACRYDIMGKAYIGTPMKYYFTDLGLAGAELAFRQEELPHAMENAVYNELRIRGFDVDIGNVAVNEPNRTGTMTRKMTEIDFVCNKDSLRVYVQVAYSMETEEKRRQEMRPLLRLRDAHRKVIVTYAPVGPYFTEEGILVMGIHHFLRTPDALTACVV